MGVRAWRDSNRERTCHLHPGRHSEATALADGIESADGLVLEAAGSPYEALELDGFRQHDQCGQTLAANLRGPRLSVYVVDIPPEGGIEAYHDGWLDVDYGTAHLDIYAYLRHPRLRRAVLWYYRRHNVTGRDGGHVDRALAFEFGDLTTWNATEPDDGGRYRRTLLEFGND